MRTLHVDMETHHAHQRKIHQYTLHTLHVDKDPHYADRRDFYSYAVRGMQTMLIDLPLLCMVKIYDTYQHVVYTQCIDIPAVDVHGEAPQ